MLRTGLNFYQVRQSLSVVLQEMIPEDIVLNVMSTGIVQKDFYFLAVTFILDYNVSI